MAGTGSAVHPGVAAPQGELNLRNQTFSASDAFLLRQVEAGDPDTALTGQAQHEDA